MWHLVDDTQQHIINLFISVNCQNVYVHDNANHMCIKHHNIINDMCICFIYIRHWFNLYKQEHFRIRRHYSRTDLMGDYKWFSQVRNVLFTSMLNGALSPWLKSIAPIGITHLGWINKMGLKITAAKRSVQELQWSVSL